MNRAAAIACCAVCITWCGLLAAEDEPDAFGKAQRALGRLAGMRHVAGVTEAEVAAVLDPAIRALGAADQEMSNRPAPDSRSGPEDRAELRVHRCGLAFFRGELYRRAAEALPSEAARRDEYARKGIETFQAMRLEYRDLPAGRLGYIGEARVHRAMGRLDRAAASLDPLRGDTPREKSGVDPRVQRLAVLERVELELLHDPDKALRSAEAAARTPEFLGDDVAMAHLDWARARAHALRAARSAEAGDAEGTATSVEAVLPLLRADAVIGAAPQFDRLSLLAELESLERQPLMTSGELLAWADLLAAARQPDPALAAYERAAGQSAEAFTAQQWMAYARLLWDKGRSADAADRFDQALRSIPPEDPLRIDALRYRAAALISARRGEGGDVQPALTLRARAALMELANSPADEPVRRSALRQWAHLSGETEPSEIVKVLRARHDLVKEDPHLRYTLALAEWRVTQQGFHSQATAADDAQKEANRIVGDLAAIAAAADEAGAEDVRAASGALGATIYASPLLNDPRSAMGLLDSAWPAIVSTPSVATHATPLRLRLLLALGLSDAAYALVADVPDNAPFPPALVMEAAEALADRYKPVRGTNAPQTPDTELRDKVLELVNWAMERAAGTEADYIPLVRRAAQSLLRVEAFPDAQRLLAHIGEERSAGGSGLETALLEAEALRGDGRYDEAIVLLEAIAKDSPQTRVLMLLGDLRAELGQHGAALAAYREARKLGKPGTEAWWDATLALVRTLAESGQAANARDILRVAVALYPVSNRPSLQGRINAASQAVLAPGASKP